MFWDICALLQAKCKNIQGNGKQECLALTGSPVIKTGLITQQNTNDSCIGTSMLNHTIISVCLIVAL